MDERLFNRDITVARVGAVSAKKLDDEFFSRDTEVARIPPGDLSDDEANSPAGLKDAIAENAKGPKRVQGDSGSVEQHSLQDQIAAERFLQSKKAAQGKNFPLKIFKIAPDGTT